jgi:hypothetical protein
VARTGAWSRSTTLCGAMGAVEALVPLAVAAAHVEESTSNVREVRGIALGDARRARGLLKETA